jgi:hypothetical protein
MATLKADLLRKMLEKLTGKKLEAIRNPPAEARTCRPGVSDRQVAWANVPENQNTGQGWGMQIEAYRRHEEAEKVCVQAQGKVQTADGRCIEVDLSLLLARVHVEQTDLHLQFGQARLKDPLVVNFAAPSARLTERSFSFDLDADGVEESLARLGEGSGFLALDGNGNGIIDDGRELFGPATQDGFAELAAHDQDGNGWIDEGDEVFDQLRIWSPGEGSEAKLRSLEQLGIGALCLSSARTSFDLTGPGNELLGRLRSTSLFLAESGRAGTLQQIDLAT